MDYNLFWDYEQNSNSLPHHIGVVFFGACEMVDLDVKLKEVALLDKEILNNKGELVFKKLQDKTIKGRLRKVSKATCV